MTSSLSRFPRGQRQKGQLRVLDEAGGKEGGQCLRVTPPFPISRVFLACLFFSFLLSAFIIHVRPSSRCSSAVPAQRPPSHFVSFMIPACNHSHGCYSSPRRPPERPGQRTASVGTLTRCKARESLAVVVQVTGKVHDTPNSPTAH